MTIHFVISRKSGHLPQHVGGQCPEAGVIIRAKWYKDCSLSVQCIKIKGSENATDFDISHHISFIDIGHFYNGKWENRDLEEIEVNYWQFKPKAIPFKD